MPKNNLDSLDLSSTINKYNLRDYPTNVDDHLQAIEILSENLDTEDIELKIRLLGQIGTFSRRINHLTEAKITFIQAIQLAKDNSLDQRYIMANSLRLAHTLHWHEDYKSAHQIFEDVISICKTEDKYHYFLDFAYQHFGKCWFDQNKFNKALHYFNLALKLREAKKDKSLIESTNIAIAATKKKLGL